MSHPAQQCPYMTVIVSFLACLSSVSKANQTCAHHDTSAYQERHAIGFKSVGQPGNRCWTLRTEFGCEFDTMQGCMQRHTATWGSAAAARRQHAALRTCVPCNSVHTRHTDASRLHGPTHEHPDWQGCRGPSSAPAVLYPASRPCLSALLRPFVGTPRQVLIVQLLSISVHIHSQYSHIA